LFSGFSAILRQPLPTEALGKSLRIFRLCKASPARNSWRRYATVCLQACQSRSSWRLSGYTLMPAVFTTLPHFSVSAAMKVPNSAGDNSKGVVTKSARCALMIGFSNPALISRLSFSMISGGVPFGDAHTGNRTYHVSGHELAHGGNRW
jgi:hypothetical protein